MEIKKSLVLILLCATVIQNIDAGWRDQWKKFTNYFSGFRIKKPSLTNKQMIIGGVGALAIATGTVWWYKRSKNQAIQKQRKANVALQEKQTQDTKASFESKTRIAFKVQDSVKVIGSRDKNNFFLYVENVNQLGIVAEVNEKTGYIAVDIILNALGENPERLVTIRNLKQDFFEKIELESGKGKQFQKNQEVIVLKNLDEKGDKWPCIARVIEQNGNDITVKVGSKSKEIPLQEMQLKNSDVLVEKESNEE